MLNNKKLALRTIITSILVSYVSNYNIDDDDDSNLIVRASNINLLIYLINKLSTFNYRNVFNEYKIILDLKNKMIHFIKNDE